MPPNTTIQFDSGNHPLPVEWHDCSWQPFIRVHSPVNRPPAAFRNHRIKPLLLPTLLPHHAPRKSRKSELPVTQRTAPAQPRFPGKNLFKLMKKNPSGPRRFNAGFTLVELLTVIAIIAILASMLLPVLSHMKTVAYKNQARIQVNDIATAIQAYDSAYGRFPVSTNAQAQADQNSLQKNNPLSQNGDFTFGGTFTNESGNAVPVNSIGYVTNNAEVIAILMDLPTYPNGIASPDFNHVKNPQQTKFLNAKMVSDTVSPGVGTDCVYRDPWGRPYIISLDLNYDGQCEDWLYCQKSVSLVSASNPSVGYNGLVNPNALQAQYVNDFQFHGTVMVWSAGPDGKVSQNLNGNNKANGGVNKDNILSWQQ